MNIRNLISAFLGFKTLPTTILLVLVYTAIFISVLVTDELPDVPKDRGGLDLDQANTDLHQIAARPHPYNSHSNDVVHSYLLTRLNHIASLHPHVHVIEDLVSNASWAVSNQQAVYFEGTNILVKIDSSDPDPGYQGKGGVLFSAHYDSVSTAPGVTDDGMGVATLLQMVSYLAETQDRKRTAIFNFNNGEEDGLMGAHAFMEHPWSNITDTFLNLEGAAAGGRPMLFRATSHTPLLSFRSAHVPHPHANILSADGFARGLIRSGTDYSVYAHPKNARGAMEGLDFAFYRGRSKYHTKYDSVPWTVGGKRALWAMMEAVRGAGEALVNFDDSQTSNTKEGAVYFDLFARTLVIFPLYALLAGNIILLAIGPVTLLGLFFARYSVGNRHYAGVRPRTSAPETENENGNEENGSEIVVHNGHQLTWKHYVSIGWPKIRGTLSEVATFWIAVVGGAGAQALLVLAYVKLNPFIVYSHPYLVLVSSLSLMYLSIVLLLNININVASAQQRHAILTQTYVLTYILLFLSTILVAKAGVGGLYFVSLWNMGVLLAIVVGAFSEGVDADIGTTEVEGGGYGENHNARSHSESPDAHEESEAQPTENTPLIPHHITNDDMGEVCSTSNRCSTGWWCWVVQLLLIIPVPVILVCHIAVFVMSALSQTLADGSSPVTVYGSASLLSFLIILPLAPFSSKLHRHLTVLILLAFIVSTAYTFIAFPFSQDAPLKVFFQQRLELDLGTRSNLSANDGTVVRAVTALTGVPAYLDTHIIPHLPSAWGTQRQCESQPRRPGLITCTWDSGLLPVPDGMISEDNSNKDEDIRVIPADRWLHMNTTRLGPTSARISLKGTNTRACRVYFNDTLITKYRIHGSSGSLQSGYEMPPSGVHELTLWSRTWGRTFIVDVHWAKKPKSELTNNPIESNRVVEGQVACEWVEYESATVWGSGSRGKIPALEEVLSFLPKWAVVSKMTDGLVEARGVFTL